MYISQKSNPGMADVPGQPRNVSLVASATKYSPSALSYHE